MTVDELLQKLEEIGKCIHGNCIVWNKSGTHTNARCRCWREKWRMELVNSMYKKFIEELER